MELQDKVAIITGGGYGIGREIALTFAGAGASVVIAARSLPPLAETQQEIEKLGRRVLTVQTDVSREADCARLIERTLSEFSRLDILVNNAGIAGPTRHLTEMSLSE